MIFTRNHKRLALLALITIGLALFSCSSDLLSSPPATITVSLTGAPAVTATFASASIAFSTDQSVTVSVEYGTVQGIYSTSVPRTTANSANHTVSVANLNSSTTYYYRVISYLGSARSFQGAEYSFTTLPDPLAAVALSGAPVSIPLPYSSTVTFNTTVTATYALEYGTAPGAYTKATPQTTVVNTSHSAALTNLLPATTYYFRIAMYLSGNLEANSAQYSFITAADPDVLSISSGPTPAYPSYTSLTINWTSSHNSTHVLEYGTANGGPYPFTVANTTPALGHSETLTGLATGTTYYYRIRLQWDTGADFVSVQFTATTTSETAPTAAQKARGVWILGGLSGTAVGSTVGAIDLYDPVLNTWYPAAATTTGYVPVSFAACAAYNGKLYVFGGFNSAGVVQALVQVYTIATNTWSLGTAMPIAKANINASMLGDRIYILGGTTANAALPWAATATTYEYSATGNSWIATKVAYGAAGSERFSYAYDGTVYNLGGRTAALTLALTHDGLLPTTVAQPTNGELDGAAVAELAMSAARTGFTAGIHKPTATPAFVYLIGGASVLTATTGCYVNQGTSGATILNTVQYMHYPFATPRTWVNAGVNPTYPSAIAFGASVVSTALGAPRIYHFGGTQVLGVAAAGQPNGYWIPTPPDPQSTWNDNWTAISTTGISARWGHGAVTLNQ